MDNKLNEIKKFNLKEIGLKKLIIIMLSGVALIIISASELMTANSTKTKSNTYNNSDIQEQVDKQNNYDTLFNTKTAEEYAKELEEKLKNVLCKVYGIGNVEVMITIDSMNEQVVLKDEPSESQDTVEEDSDGGKRQSNNDSSQETTVIMEDSDGNMTPYIVKVIQPTILGIVVVADGGDNVMIKNEIIEAVKVLFDVESHKIKVMKMNSDYQEAK